MKNPIFKIWLPLIRSRELGLNAGSEFDNIFFPNGRTASIWSPYSGYQAKWAKVFQIFRWFAPCLQSHIQLNAEMFVQHRKKNKKFKSSFVYCVALTVSIVYPVPSAQCTFQIKYKMSKLNSEPYVWLTAQSTKISQSPFEMHKQSQPIANNLKQHNI